jgi:HD-GYP domain-containing protein (c-di-GMP phosphodiesterase class II)
MSLSAVTAARALVLMLEDKDPYLRGHSDRVAGLAVSIGVRLGMRDGDLHTLELLAQLHDIGKIGVDASLLLKPAALTRAEERAIRRHVEIGEAMVSDIASLAEHADVVGQHHERWDGRGYVRGLAGDRIRLEARVIAVADAFDAMTSARAYRPAFGATHAAAEIARCAGHQFDPAVAAVLADLVGAGAVDGARRQPWTLGTPSPA